MSAIGRPVGDVIGAGAANEVDEHADLVVGDIEDAQGDVFIGRVTGCAFVVGEDEDRFAIGRGMRRPVDEVVGGDLLGVGAVGEHAPDLHGAAAIGVEVEIFAVG